jgi:UDP-2,3-diacylglucosamine pyrophosphatase LpxH
MPDIRFVCLSDMHFGEEDSLLTNLKTASTDTDPSKPSPVIEQLVVCLEHLISRNEDKAVKPTLILAGDILETALCETNEAVMAFERFLEIVLRPDYRLFDRIIYIPGNHDHHVWESARETQYVDHLAKIPAGKELPIPWHTTELFLEHDPDPVPCYLLNGLARRHPHLRDCRIEVAYPNIGFYREKGAKCVIFHHGHFVEPLYLLMSTLRNLIFPDRERPGNVWDLESENFAWIDFFWSTMGRSGTVGKDVELIYEKIQDRERFKNLLFKLAEGLAGRHDLPGLGNAMESQFLKWIFGALVDRASERERTITHTPLSEPAADGLRDYVQGPVRKQILSERAGNMPRDVTFIFGHTHKPFQEDMKFKYFPEWVNVYNTGGWVVETVKAEPLHGGAVVLLDENLDALSLRMYNENEDPQGYSVKVEEALHPGAETSPFCRRISGLVNPVEDPWAAFSAVAARAVQIRARNLAERIDRES